MCVPQRDFEPNACREVVNRWIVGETAKTVAQVTQAIEAHKFNEAAGAVYRFAWGTFCDWYVEFIKPLLAEASLLAREETRACAAWTLQQILHLLHPFMPFVTEELWQNLMEPGEMSLVVCPWPDHSSLNIDADAGTEMDWVVRLVSDVRAVRVEMNVPPGVMIDMHLLGSQANSRRRLAAHEAVIKRLARIRTVVLDGSVPAGSAQLVVDEATVVLPLAGVIDVAKERDRLGRELGRLDGEIAKLDAKLDNADFLAKAPGQVVEMQRERRAEAEGARSRLAEALVRIGADT